MGWATSYGIKSCHQSRQLISVFPPFGAVLPLGPVEAKLQFDDI